jgi:hypothetical protein
MIKKAAVEKGRGLRDRRMKFQGSLKLISNLCPFFRG